MRPPDLPDHVQTALIFAVLLATGSAVFRSIIALARQLKNVPHQYPAAWTSAQIGLLERFRISLGIALLIMWGVLSVLLPEIPGSGPFGLMQALLLIIVLLLTGAWVRLISPSEWKHTFIGKMRFKHALACLIIVWGMLLGGSLFTIARSTASTVEGPVHVFGHYA